MGPNGTSLLHKLGFKLAYEMSDSELLALVRADRDRRTKSRALVRAARILNETPKILGRPKKIKIAAKLEDYGIAVEIANQIRIKSGKSDEVLIKEFHQKGLL